MPVKPIMGAALVLSSIASVALTPVEVRAQAVPQPMPFTQCVKNVFGTGYVASVVWYNSTDVDYTPASTSGDDPTTKYDPETGKGNEAIPSVTLKPYAKPVREDVVPLGGQSCNTGITGVQTPQFATVGIWGAKYVNQSIAIGAATVIGVVGSAACIASALAACGAIAGMVASVAQGGVGLALVGIPDSKGIFWAGSPGQLEISGPAWEPIVVDKTPGVAALSFLATVDYCVAGLSDTSSASNISVEFLAGGNVVGTQPLKGANLACTSTQHTATARLTSDQNITAMRIVTDGGDAMLIDQALLYRDGQKIVWEGRDNGGSWCLSTDPMDFQGGWEATTMGTGQCQSKVTFSQLNL